MAIEPEPRCEMFIIYALLGYCLLAIVIAAVVLRRSSIRARADAGASFIASAGITQPDAHLLHRVTLRGRPVRFFRSPLIGPDFPWTVLRDLFDAATGGARYTVGAEWIYANNPRLAQVMRTANGSELAVSHWAALELLATLETDPERRDLLIVGFREATAEAYVLQWSDLSRDQFLALCGEASRRRHAPSA